MISWEVLFGQIASVVAVIALGWLLLRLKTFPAEMIRPACKLVLDVTLPAMILTRMVLHVPADALVASWYLPFLAAAFMALSQLVCRLACRLASDAHRPTLELCATFPNWFYLSLAVLEPVFGAEATRTLLLLNIGYHGWIWTMGLLPFGARGQSVAARFLRIFITPPFLATGLGILAVLFAPWLKPLAETPVGSVAQLAWPHQALFIVWHALDLVAAITIPLTLLTVGAQLGTATFAGHGGLWGTVWGVLLRLGVVPAITLGAMAGALALGWRPTHAFFLVNFLTAAMPTAVVCGQIAELYEGDAPLAGRLTFLTTLLALATVPLWSVAGGWIWTSMAPAA